MHSPCSSRHTTQRDTANSACKCTVPTPGGHTCARTIDSTYRTTTDAGRRGTTPLRCRWPGARTQSAQTHAHTHQHASAPRDARLRMCVRAPRARRSGGLRGQLRGRRRRWRCRWRPPARGASGPRALPVPPRPRSHLRAQRGPSGRVTDERTKGEIAPRGRAGGGGAPSLPPSSRPRRAPPPPTRIATRRRPEPSPSGRRGCSTGCSPPAAACTTHQISESAQARWQEQARGFSGGWKASRPSSRRVRALPRRHLLAALALRRNPLGRANFEDPLDTIGCTTHELEICCERGKTSC